MNILKDAPDWTISRNRYWASSIPVWKCDSETCSEVRVMGSIADLQEHATTEIAKDLDLHKHVVDKVKLKCSCGGEMSRISEVFDCWVESGSMPFAQYHYPFENKEAFEKSSPSEFVSEYEGQIRTWFYYMLVMSVILFDKVPFKNILVTGTVMASDGTKMSKSKGNFTDPMLLVDQYGSDAMRHYLLSSPVVHGESPSFKDEGVQESMRKVVMLSYNILNFYKLFAGENTEEVTASENILDKWVLARVELAVKEMTAHYNAYELVKGNRVLIPLIDDISTWYVRRSRDRFKTSSAKASAVNGNAEQDKQWALTTLESVLTTLAKLLAPVAPFAGERIWQELGKLNSVHKELWPKNTPEQENKEVLEQMEKVRKVVEKVHAMRAEAKLKVRQPLQTCQLLKVSITDESLLNIIAEEINVKKVEVVDALDKGEQWLVNKDNDLEVALNTEITPELKEEGMLRDLVRNLNGLRKKAGLSVGDQVKMEYETESTLIAELIEKYKEDLMGQTLSTAIETVTGLNPQDGDVRNFKMEGTKVLIRFS